MHEAMRLPETMVSFWFSVKTGNLTQNRMGGTSYILRTSYYYNLRLFVGFSNISINVRSDHDILLWI